MREKALQAMQDDQLFIEQRKIFARFADTQELVEKVLVTGRILKDALARVSKLISEEAQNSATDSNGSTGDSGLDKNTKGDASSRKPAFYCNAPSCYCLLAWTIKCKILY